MTAFRSSFLMAGVFGLALLTSCTQFGYKVREIQSAVPYYRINLKEHGAPGIQEYFFLGLQCLDPLTVVFAGYTGGGQPDPNHYYALIRFGNTWQKVHLTGKLQLYSPHSHSPWAYPPDGWMYENKLKDGLPKGFPIHSGTDYRLPENLDLAWLKLDRVPYGGVSFYHLDEHDISKSLIMIAIGSAYPWDKSKLEVYEWGTRKQVISASFSGSHVWSLKYVSAFPFKEARFFDGFVAFQTNLHEALLFDLRSYWPPNLNAPPAGISTPKCVPLL